MIRTLLIITGASLVLCAAAAAGAVAIGGRDLAANGWTWTFKDDEGPHTVHFERGESGPHVSRTLAWTGTDRLGIEVPGDVNYTQGPTASVVVSGPRSLVDRVKIVGGRITYDQLPGVDRVVFGWNVNNGLKITVTAPAVTTFDLEESADLVISGYDQPTLGINVAGSGEANVSGKTRAVTVNLSGSGEVDLTELETTDADISIDGSGDVAVGPAGAARIDIDGSGDVTLTRRPASLTQNVSGSGDVNQE